MVTIYGYVVWRLTEEGKKEYYSIFTEGEKDIFSDNPRHAFVFTRTQDATRVAAMMPDVIVEILFRKSDLEKYALEE